VAVITGASSGIGRATARELGREGAKLVLAARTEDALRALADEIGGDTLPVRCDVTEQADVDALLSATLERFGRVDALLPNAGVYLPGPFAENDPADVARLIDTNLTGVMRVVRGFLPTMTRQGAGDVLVTSSVSGHQPIWWEPVYSASKHAIRAFVHGVRREVAPHGVRVGAVAPGVVLNELWNAQDDASIAAGVRDATGIRSEDVADVIVFMLSRPPHVTIRDLVVLPHAQEI
jgi:ribitol 2-dehydrogenase